MNELAIGDVIKYQFAFPQQETAQGDIMTGTALAEVVNFTPKAVVLEYNDVYGKPVQVPFANIIAVYRILK